MIVAHGAVIKVLRPLSLDLHPDSYAPCAAWNDFNCPNLGLYELVHHLDRWHLGESGTLLSGLNT